MNALFLAFEHLRWAWARSLILVLVAALILTVPSLTQTLLRGTEQELTARAEATPLVLGARGSRLDLVMNAVYFSSDLVEPVRRAAEDSIWDSGLALPIPLLTEFDANGTRIVGTSLDYFEFRALDFADGRPFALLGEAVLGAKVADRLGLGARDTIVSTPQSMFDLDGVYPLEMKVVGVLEPSGTPDDMAIFVDVKTTWVISGIGHGHDDVVAQGDSGRVVASSAITQFTRITPENIDSFHFHGASSSHPLSAILVVPYDKRSETILRGRYLDPENPLQLVVPNGVIDGLVQRIFRIASLLDAISLITGVAAAAAAGLSLFLAWQLRTPEMQTARALGAGRFVILRLAATEIVILLLVSVKLSLLLSVTIHTYGDRIVGWVLTL